jgi:hypothetical protein
MLEHRHRIRALRNGGPSHNLNRTPGSQRAASPTLARAHLPHQPQPLAGTPLLSPHRKSIPRRAIERRLIAVRPNLLRQHPSRRREQRNSLLPARTDAGRMPQN